MKILELTTYSAGICGVWARVKEEAMRLSKKKHNIKIFSSNFIKGSKNKALQKEHIGKIEIIRFPAIKLGGESFMKWNYEKEALKFAPDIIIAHAYRHTHTLKALRITKKLRENGKKCKVFLVTHAPFERSSTRNLMSKLSVWYYDKFIAPKTINKFDKIITITKWEIPYLLKLGAKKDKIEYVPNGIPEEFFAIKKSANEENKMLFLGRVSPIKNIETIISAMPLLRNKEIKLEIVGPAEENYLRQLKKQIERLGIGNRVIFSKPIFDIKQKIKKIDSARIFVLPSKSEGMPQSLIEAMAREKIVISSNNFAGKELITDGKNGFLFKIGDENGLAQKIDSALKMKGNRIGKEARKSVEKFKWDMIINKLEKIIKK